LAAKEQNEAIRAVVYAITEVILTANEGDGAHEQNISDQLI